VLAYGALASNILANAVLNFGANVPVDVQAISSNP